MIHLVIPTYNCGLALQNNFARIQAQTATDFRVTIVDDASTESLHKAVCAEYASDNGWLLVTNVTNMKAPYTIKQGIEASGATKDDVIFLCDGDDFLPPWALQRISEIYDQYPELWLTYGNYQPYPYGWDSEAPATEYPTLDRWERNFRHANVNRYNHPLTFRRGLWDHLNDTDLKDNDGHWFRSCYDEVIMTPLLEMAAPDHYAFIDEMLYYYNSENPLSEARIDVYRRVEDIWDRPKKQPLSNL